MVFCLIIFALTGAIAYFHYVQGLFGSALSAIVAAFAAVLALGWYEQVAPFLFKIGFNDQAASISIVVIFTVAYIIPRLALDSFVPGNVRMPVLVDKIGAGVMGLIAGLIATGIVAVAADALPFGNTLAMYSRFSVTDKTGQFMGPNGQEQDTQSYDVVTADKIDPDDPAQSHLWLRQDDLVVALVKRVSDPDGSMSYDHSFASVHPDLLDEFYAQRIGIQVGAKHSAITTDQNQAVAVTGIWAVAKPLPQVDGVVGTMRGGDPLPPIVPVDADQIAMVVRMKFLGKDIADDADSILRFSAGTLRFVAGQPDNNVPFKNYYPVATLDPKGVAVACRPDDFLLADLTAARTIDFVFVVDRDHVLPNDKPNPPFPLPSGTFLEFKRYSTADLSGKNVEYGPTSPSPDKIGVMRVRQVSDMIARAQGISFEGGGPAPESSSSGTSASSSTGGGAVAPPVSSGTSEGGATSAAPISASPVPGGKALGDSGLFFADITVSNKLVAPINPGMGNDSGTVQLPNGVGGELVRRQWQTLTVNTDTPMKKLGAGDDNVQELAVDPNMVLVQVECTPPVSGAASDVWAWGKRVSDFALADATGKTFKCVGAWATVQRSAQHYLVVNYMDFDDQNHLQPLTVDKGRPVEVWLAFEVPAGTPIAEIRFSASTVLDNLNFNAR